MSVTPRFETENILLRPFEPGDAPSLHAYLSHPELAGRRYIPWKFEQTLPIPVKTAEAVIDDWLGMENGFCFAVVMKQDNRVIGHIRSDWGWDPHMPELAVVIDPAHQRKAYGRQALTLVLDYLYSFTIAHNISNGIEDWNRSGINFAQSMGFSHVGTIRRTTFRAGQFHDDLIYDILKPEWKERRHAA